jgi:hypothetical protein
MLGPRVFIDNQEVQVADPFPGAVHKDRQIDVRFR